MSKVKQKAGYIALQTIPEEPRTFFLLDALFNRIQILLTREATCAALKISSEGFPPKTAFNFYGKLIEFENITMQ